MFAHRGLQLKAATAEGLFQHMQEIGRIMALRHPGKSTGRCGWDQLGQHRRFFAARYVRDVWGQRRWAKLSHAHRSATQHSPQRGENETSGRTVCRFCASECSWRNASGRGGGRTFCRLAVFREARAPSGITCRRGEVATSSASLMRAEKPPPPGLRAELPERYPAASGWGRALWHGGVPNLEPPGQGEDHSAQKWGRVRVWERKRHLPPGAKLALRALRTRRFRLWPT